MPQHSKNALPVELCELQRNRLFASLAHTELEHLTTILTRREFKAGKYIIREATDGTCMYFVVAGRLKVCRSARDGKEVTIALCGPGDLVGEIALLTGSVRTADVVALTPVTVWECACKDIEAHCRSFAGLSYALLRYTALRVRNATNRISDLALYDVTCRVARALLEMSVLVKREEVEVHLISNRPTHQLLAELVGASREAVTRAVRALEDDGHLEVDDDRMWLNSIPE